jgi:hypothetical protein
MPTWSIEIVEKDGKTSFSPANQNALQDDLISWNNTTNDRHQPWMITSVGPPPVPVADPRKKIDPNKPLDECSNPPGPPNFDPKSRMVPTYLSDCIPPGGSSRPAYDVGQAPGTKVLYYCKVHPAEASEQGSITVVAQPAAG